MTFQVVGWHWSRPGGDRAGASFPDGGGLEGPKVGEENRAEGFLGGDVGPSEAPKVRCVIAWGGAKRNPGWPEDSHESPAWATRLRTIVPGNRPNSQLPNPKNQFPIKPKLQTPLQEPSNLLKYSRLTSRDIEFIESTLFGAWYLVLGIWAGADFGNTP